MAETEALLAAWAGRAGPEDNAWETAQPGPALAIVATRMSSVPRPFLDARVSLAALAGDILSSDGATDGLTCVGFADDERVRLGAAIGLWLIASEVLIEPFSPRLSPQKSHLAVDALALRLASTTHPLDWLSDDERREEAARTFLLWSGYLPAGETSQSARSLLDARDSLRRNAALAQAYAEHRHRADLARALAEARAKEAAARYAHE
ncbi:MAG: phosphohydrolase [Phycicoccus sp.]|nr:phosphohydrolase [Phycicoccus sp.]